MSRVRRKSAKIYIRTRFSSELINLRIKIKQYNVTIIYKSNFQILKLKMFQGTTGAYIRRSTLNYYNTVFVTCFNI